MYGAQVLRAFNNCAIEYEKAERKAATKKRYYNIFFDHLFHSPAFFFVQPISFVRFLTAILLTVVCA